jgi:alpha,alpha-trehalase
MHPSHPERYGACLTHIDDYWDTLTAETPSDRGLVIGLPHPYVCPSRVEFDEKMYYWDTYFINLGLLVSGRVQLARAMVDNFVYLFERFGFIPQSNRFYHLGKSNPPLLTSMISDVFSKTGDRRWLARTARAAAAEYSKIWTGVRRLTDTGLSRYFEPTHTHEQAEDESGWDRTSRFYDRCLHINPVDLNALLFKYENDLARFADQLGRPQEAQAWRKKSRRRKRLVNTLMWDAKSGFFFDYDYVAQKRTRAWSLAGFFPLWTGLASKKQARCLKAALRPFEHRGGLSTTRRIYGGRSGRQWDHPNGWPNLHWVVISGLRKYGFYGEADRVASKWLDTCNRVFEQTGELWEKYDVVRRRPSHIGRYETQAGFGWTNGVFAALTRSTR